MEYIGLSFVLLTGYQYALDTIVFYNIVKKQQDLKFAGTVLSEMVD